MSTSVSTPEDTRLIEEILARLTADLSMIMDRDMSVEGCSTERADSRPAGAGEIHISFRLKFDLGGTERFGYLLMPLPAAKTIAGYFMMIPDEQIEVLRQEGGLDAPTKDAILEIGNFMGSACDAVLASSFSSNVTVRAAGCQGVRADVRPAFPYEEGSELLVGRGQLRVHTFDPCGVILMIPPPDPGEG